MLLLCSEQYLSSDQKTCLFSLRRAVGEYITQPKDPYWPTTTRQYNGISQGFATLLAWEDKQITDVHMFHLIHTCKLFVCLWSVGYAAGQEEHNGANMK